MPDNADTAKWEWVTPPPDGSGGARAVVRCPCGNEMRVIMWSFVRQGKWCPNCGVKLLWVDHRTTRWRWDMPNVDQKTRPVWDRQAWYLYRPQCAVDPWGDPTHVLKTAPEYVDPPCMAYNNGGFPCGGTAVYTRKVVAGLLRGRTLFVCGHHQRLDPTTQPALFHWSPVDYYRLTPGMLVAAIEVETAFRDRLDPDDPADAAEYRQSTWRLGCMGLIVAERRADLTDRYRRLYK